VLNFLWEVWIKQGIFAAQTPLLPECEEKSKKKPISTC
jgi:hypothetical protein